MRAGPRPVRLLVGAAVVGAGALTATLAPPASAAVGPKAVQGGSVEAWQASYYRPPVAAKVPTATYYFTGGPNDDLARFSSAPSSTFGRAKPVGGTDSSQTTNPAVKIAGDPGNAVWTAPYSGPIQGRITLDWWWATLDAASGLGGANATVNVIADPGTPAQKTIGTNGILISAFGSGPQKVTSVVDVKGVVAKTLKIQVIPTYVDASQDLRVYYGSAAHPSSFAIPTKPLPPVKVPTTTRVRDTNPLVLSATPIGHDAGEPTIGITKQGNAFFAAIAFDNVVGEARTKIFGSYDGNKSWRDVSPNLLSESFPPASLDPYLYVDQETGRIFSDDLTVGCSVLQWSDDQGKTWSRGNPLACELPVDDHQTLVAGNPPPGISTSGYPNVLYYCVNKIGTSQCARSTDGGNTFSVTGGPAFVAAQEAQDGGNGTPGFCGGLHGHIATDPAGRLYLPKGHCGSPWLAVSEDGGVTWRQTKVNRMNVAGIQTAVTTDKAGNVYYTWWDADTKLPYMAVSKDAGKSFGPALLVAPPGLRGVNFPSIDAGDKGHVVITYPGTTDPESSKASRPWNYYVAVTDNALANRPVFHSATANPLSDPVHRGACLGRCAGMFDFLDVVVAPSGELWATEVDTCTKACVSAKGPTLSTSEAPKSAVGVAVRQLSGPGLRRR